MLPDPSSRYHRTRAMAADEDDPRAEEKEAYKRHREAVSQFRKNAPRRVPKERDEAARRISGVPGLSKKPRGRPGVPVEVSIPVDPSGSRATMVAVPQPPPLPEGADDAPPPPPGYRYDMRGRLVPLMIDRLPISDPKNQEIFLEIVEITGNLRAAMDALGHRTHEAVATEMEVNPEFRERLDVAFERHRQSIYQAAYSRAVNGWEVPIIGGKFKDEIVAYERRYSDSLMALFLKRHFPEFREAAASSTTKVTVNNQPVLRVDVSKLNAKQRANLRSFLETEEREMKEQLQKEQRDDAESAKQLPHLADGAIDVGSE